jgi:hypothetical protein
MIIETRKFEMPVEPRFVRILSGLFGKRRELCCPGGIGNETVDQFRREGLHFGRLR